MNPKQLPGGKPKKCVDCDPGSKRPAPHPGPRCHTHHKARGAHRKQVSRELRLHKTFSITNKEYEEIKAEQGGQCICGEWTGYNGRSRNLSVDHDHATGYVRGVLCKHCNDLLGRVKDDPRYFEKMAEYLRNPPAFRVIGKRVAEGAPRHGRCPGLTRLNAGHLIAACGSSEAHKPHPMPLG